MRLKYFSKIHIHLYCSTERDHIFTSKWFNNTDNISIWWWWCSVMIDRDNLFHEIITIVSSSKMIWMEKQLESLTELVKELTRERALNEQQLSNRTGIYKGIFFPLILIFLLKRTAWSNDEGHCSFGYRFIFTPMMSFPARSTFNLGQTESTSQFRAKVSKDKINWFFFVRCHLIERYFFRH